MDISGYFQKSGLLGESDFENTPVLYNDTVDLKRQLIWLRWRQDSATSVTPYTVDINCIFPEPKFRRTWIWGINYGVHHEYSWLKWSPLVWTLECDKRLLLRFLDDDFLSDNLSDINTSELAPESFLLKVGGETEHIEDENTRNQRDKN